MSLINIFSKLYSENKASGNFFTVESIPYLENHKLGITKDNRPIFFVQCETDDSIKAIDLNLELIKVQYNRKCKLIQLDSTEIDDCYTLIELKSEVFDLQSYFIEVINLLIKNIGISPTFKILKQEVEKVTKLFSILSKPGIKSIQGIWGELLIISESNDPDYLIKAWHVNSKDKFDFNDGEDKIEVKTTSKENRIHIFSYDQLTPNQNSKLIITSIKTIQTGIGINIPELVDIIKSKGISTDSLYKMQILIGETLGKDIEKINEIKFDYRQAVDSIRYFESIKIPIIDSKNIPEEISNLKFDCNLENCEYIEVLNYISKLHSTLKLI